VQHTSANGSTVYETINNFSASIAGPNGGVPPDNQHLLPYIMSGTNTLQGTSGDDLLLGEGGTNTFILGTGNESCQVAAGAHNVYVIAAGCWHAGDAATVGAGDTIRLENAGSVDFSQGGMSLAGSATIEFHSGSSAVSGLDTSTVSTFTVTGGGSDTVIFNSGRGGDFSGKTFTNWNSTDKIIIHGAQAVAISGTAQKDIIESLRNESVTGGGGADTFVLNPGIASVTITDFTAGQHIDKIDLTAFSNLHTLNDVLALATQSGPNTTLINFGNGDGLTLNNVNKTALASDDFIFSPAPPPPGGTTADMILRHGADGLYEIYDIGNNSLLAAYQLGQVGTDWKFVTLGGFYGNDTTDMLLRSSTTGGFEVYDISNNRITGAAFLGNVGMDWQAMGFGNFSSRGENDMILRNVNNGGVEVYDVSNNQITGAALLGTVGLNWQFSGIGNFSGRGESDMLLRNANTGGLYVYDIANNTITNAAFIGTIGLHWQFSGVGNFSGVAGETDLLLRNVNNGGLEVYNINNNQLTGTAFIGTIGLDWQYAGIAPIHAAGASDLVLRNVNTGAFEVYDIVSNKLAGAASLGAVGLDWSLGGFAVDPPTGSSGSTGDSSQVGQLVQAMAAFGGSGGAADALATSPLDAETSQQPLLTAAQHA
jgi:hypothetical protein